MVVNVQRTGRQVVLTHVVSANEDSSSSCVQGSNTIKTTQFDEIISILGARLNEQYKLHALRNWLECWANPDECGHSPMV